MPSSILDPNQPLPSVLGGLQANAKELNCFLFADQLGVILPGATNRRDRRTVVPFSSSKSKFRLISFRHEYAKLPVMRYLAITIFFCIALASAAAKDACSLMTADDVRAAIGEAVQRVVRPIMGLRLPPLPAALRIWEQNGAKRWRFYTPAASALPTSVVCTPKA